MAHSQQVPEATRAFRFGPFEVSAITGELRKNGARVKLFGQPCQILLMLLRANGEVVPRDTLRAALWSSDTFVDFEHSLNTAVKKLRQALGDNADAPTYIETVPRVGYRFLAPIEAECESPFPETIPASSPTALVMTQPVAQRRLSYFAVAAVAIAVVIAIFGLRETIASQNLRIVNTRQLTFHGSQFGIFTLASDGHRVYFFKAGHPRLFSVPISGGDETSYPTHFVSPIILHISPDGSQLLVKEYANDNGQYRERLWLQPTSGAPARPLGDVQADFAAAFSPDGKTIAYAQDKTIYLTRDEGATSHASIEASNDVAWIRFSPDGQRLRFTVYDPKNSISSLWEAKLGGKPVQLPVKLPRLGALNFGSWTHEGKYFLFQNVSNLRSDYWSLRESESWTGTREPVQIASTGEITFAEPSPIANQILVAQNESLTSTFRFDPQHRLLTPFLPDRSVADPSFSADGQWLTYIDQHSSRNVLVRSHADGSDPVQLTDPDLVVRFPHISPDNKWIAFMGKPVDEPWQLYWISVDGGALHRIDAPQVVNQADANWLPDGQHLLFGQTPWYMADPNVPRALYIYDLQSGKTEKVSNSDGWFSPRLSPDGHTFLALSADEKRLAIYNSKSAAWRVIFANGDRIGAPYWSPDGTSIYANVHAYKEVFEAGGTLIRIRLSDLKPEKLVTFSEFLPAEPCNSWGLAPDGIITISCWRANADLYVFDYQ